MGLTLIVNMTQSFSAMSVNMGLVVKTLKLNATKIPRWRELMKPKLFRHVKTGGIYEVVCHATIEKTKEVAVVYRSIDTDIKWVRPLSEFFDGRFVDVSADVTPGVSDGDVCNRDGCEGILEYPPVKDCYCHLSPPCHNCTENPLTCPECGWDESDDNEPFWPSPTIIEQLIGTPTNPTQIAWQKWPHTSSSMLIKGTYPEGVTQEEVRKRVDGTFGGRFTYFDHGSFEFIAYTD